MPQTKLTTFLAKHGVKSPKKASKKQDNPRSRQARIENMAGVVKLPKMSGHATAAELHRLLAELDPNGDAEALVHALKQLACYEVTVDQLEAVPIGKRVKQLRQHSSPEVQQQAARLLNKMRADVTAACGREGRAKPIVAACRKMVQASKTARS